MEVDAIFIYVFRVDVLTAVIVAEFHDVADVFFRRHDRRGNDRLLDTRDTVWGRHIRRIFQHHGRPVHQVQPVSNRRRRRDDVEIEFAFESLLNNLIVQETEEPAPKTKAERRRCLRLERECRVIQLQTLQCIAQVGIIGAVDRIHTAKHHLVYRFIPR